MRDVQYRIVDFMLKYSVGLCLFSLLLMGCTGKQPDPTPVKGDLLPPFGLEEWRIPDSLRLLPLRPAYEFEGFYPQMEMDEVRRGYLYADPMILGVETLD